MLSRHPTTTAAAAYHEYSEEAQVVAATNVFRSIVGGDTAVCAPVT